MAIDLWLENDSHIFFDSITYIDSAVPRVECHFKAYSKKGLNESADIWIVKSLSYNADILEKQL